MAKARRRALKANAKRKRLSTSKVLATAYFMMMEEGVWSIRGAGKMYGGKWMIPMHPNLQAVLDALKRDNIPVAMKHSYPFMWNDLMGYNFDAQFDDGGLQVHTGNYIDQHGGSISGAKALCRLIGLLDRRVTPQTARAWGVETLLRETAREPSTSE